MAKHERACLADTSGYELVSCHRSCMKVSGKKRGTTVLSGELWPTKKRLYR